MKTKSHAGHIRPLRVFVGHGTKAEKGFRSRISMPVPAAIAPGLPQTPEHDLIFHGGSTIADLVFTNFYVGGSNAWQQSDIQSIDQALAAAMSDQKLNNVMSQYYRSGQITSAFRGSQVLSGPPPKVVSQGDVEDALRADNDPSAIKFLGWTSQQGEECGDFPVFEANPLSQVFQKLPLTDGSGTVPVQFQYSDADHGPGEPRDEPATFAGDLGQSMQQKAG